MKATITKPNDWLVKGISDEQLKREKLLAKISGKIQLKRIELNMDQKSFAKYMGVSQGLVSRWESGTYNFTISTLVSICEKLSLSFVPEIKDLNCKEESLIYEPLKSENKCNWADWRLSTPNRISGGVAA